MGEQEIKKNQGIQVISRAADILRLLGHETSGLSLGQIARSVKLPRSTVQRIIEALAAEGFVSRENGYGGIKLGPGIQSIAQAATSSMRNRLRLLMERISEETGETVDLAVLEGAKMLFIDQITGSQRLRAVSSIGEVFPLTTTANGKAALSCLDQARVSELVNAEIERQDKSSRSLPDLLTEIEDIRNGSLARDENEHTEGISALGFATRDQDGEIFAVSVPVPSTRYERIKKDLSQKILEFRGDFLA